MNHFTFFTKKERIGTLLLCLLLLGSIVFSHISYRETAIEPEDICAERDSVELFLSQIEKRKKKRAPYYRAQNRNEVKYFPFDPNQADSATFAALGLPSWMVDNILKYRDKGGKFYQPEDFQKIYGLSERTFQKLLPYIYIEKRKHKPVQKKFPLLRDTLRFAKAEKYEEGTVVDLNRADTAALKKIPGIGTFIARRIVSYRKQLGGYHSIRQLEEISLNSDSLIRWFSIDTAAIRKIDINRASVQKLRRHPYINFYQAKAFVEYRRKKGPIRHLKIFRLYEEFPEGSLKRMLPYLSFGSN